MKRHQERALRLARRISGHAEEAEEEVSVDYSGASLEIGFNATYVLDALQAVTDENVEIRLSDANSCCLIHAPGVNDCKYVVMPMRL